MQFKLAITATLLLFAAMPQASAQEIPNAGSATKEHQWLQRFVGQWDVVSQGSAGEGQPPIKGEALMNSSMLGELWLVNSSETKVAGMDMKSIQMIGYDPDKQKYVGIWADSMVNYMWRYEGELDQSGNKLTLEAEGPSMSGDGTMSNYRDAYEFKDKDTIIASSSMQDDNGEWVVFMQGTAKRRK